MRYALVVLLNDKEEGALIFIGHLVLLWKSQTIVSTVTPLRAINVDEILKGNSGIK